MNGSRFSNMKKILNVFKKRWYIFIIIAVGIGVFLYKQQTSKAEVAKLATYTVVRQDIQDILTLSGQVAADEHAVLRFPISGKLVWLGAKEGDKIKKYQGLASLDQREVERKLKKTLNDFVKERGDYDQSKDDNRRIGDQPTREAGDTMKRLLEKAQYDLTNAIIDVELGQLTKEYSYLTSPIDGILVRVDVKNTYVNITPSAAEFEVINPDTLYFSFTADQTEVIKLKEGMRAKVVLDSYPEESISGELYFVSFIPKTGETGTVYEGRIKIPAGRGMKYRFGMTGDSEFVMGEKSNVVVVLDKFIKSEGDKKYVWRKKNGKEEKVYIKTGLEVDGVIEALSGVKEGDVILNVQK